MSTTAARDSVHSIEHLRPILLTPIGPEPLVSVLIANYNYGRYLETAVNSALTQTYQNLEICICDDGSKDNSVEVIRSLAGREPRIKTVFQANAGAGAALSAAWNLAAGEIICLLDADDAWLPEKLARTLAAFRADSQAGLVVHAVTEVYADLKTVIRRQVPAQSSAGWWGEKFLAGAPVNMPPCSGISVRREIAREVFPVHPMFRSMHDAVFREHALILTKISAIDEPLALMRLHGENLTSTIGHPRELKTISAHARNHENRWRERARFALEKASVGTDPSLWVHEAVHLLLAEKLLTGKSMDKALIAHVRSPLKREIWQALFALPKGLASYLLLHVLWPESAIKRWARSLLINCR